IQLIDELSTVTDVIGNVWPPVSETTPLTVTGDKGSGTGSRRRATVRQSSDSADRLENEVRDKDRELSEAQAKIKALRLSERLREKVVEEVCISLHAPFLFVILFLLFSFVGVRPLFFSYKMVIRKAVVKAVSLSSAGYLVSLVLPIFVSDCKIAMRALVVEQIVFYFASCVVFLCWELNRHLLRV
ncbi:hypothetical protein M8C21_010527, partial [Ambrosia artemisiifolia]